MIRSPHTIHFTFSELQSGSGTREKGSWEGGGGWQVNIYVHVGWEKVGGGHRVHTEWQLPISGVHSIMMEKSALAGEVGSARPPAFTIFTITLKAVCTLQLRGQIHSSYFISAPICNLCWDSLTLCTLYNAGKFIIIFLEIRVW
jgi:hypothetical protein